MFILHFSMNKQSTNAVWIVDNYFFFTFFPRGWNWTATTGFVTQVTNCCVQKHTWLVMKYDYYLRNGLYYKNIIFLTASQILRMRINELSWRRFPINSFRSTWVDTRSPCSTRIWNILWTIRCFILCPSKRTTGNVIGTRKGIGKLKKSSTISYSLGLKCHTSTQSTSRKLTTSELPISIPGLHLSGMYLNGFLHALGSILKLDFRNLDS